MLGTALAGAAAGADGADGRFDKRTSSHFVLYQDVDIDRESGWDGSRSFERSVLEVLESAYDELDGRLGLRPRRPIRVVVYDPGAFDAAYAGVFRFPAAGFYGDAIHVRGGAEVTHDLVRVLHHELVHAALAAEAPSVWVPAWFNEGVAEWFEARATGKRWPSAGEWEALRRAAGAGSLPTLARLSTPTFGHLGPRDAAYAYLQSYAFVTWLAQSHGERALREVVSHLVRTGNLERAFRRGFRDGIEDTERSFRRELGAGR